MDANEPILRMLASHPLLVEADARAALQWWQTERWGDEGLGEFLVRAAVFTPDSLRTLEMIRRGVITYCDPKRIFGELGHQRLRDYSLRAGFVERGSMQLQGAQGGTPPPPPPGARINEVKAWLAQRQQSRSNPPSESFSMPAAPKSESRPVGPPSARPAPSPSSSGGPHSSGVRRAATVPPASGRRAPEPGVEIGKFLLVEQIGQGGTAVVFRALHRVLNIPVALKFLKFDTGDVLAGDHDNSVFEQLRKEAQLLARFNHPNIVRVFDFEETGDQPFLVMEFVDGLALSEMLNFCGRMRPDRAAKLLFQVADGLASAQRKIGLVHRDVKPANILLSRDGHIKLADLGLAVTSTLNQPQSETSTILAGTMAYMSPEQAQASPTVDHRSDIYSLGATFFHALTGDMPFKGKSRVELMFKHAKEPVPAPHLLVPGLDPLYTEIVHRMMAKEQRDRYQSYDELLVALTALQAKSDAAIALPSSTHQPVASAVATTPD